MIGCGRGGECISLSRIRRKSLLLAHNPTTGSGFWSLRRLNESQVGIFEEIAPGSCLDLCWAFSRIYNNGGVFPMTGWKRRRRRRRRGQFRARFTPDWFLPPRAWTTETLDLFVVILILPLLLMGTFILLLIMSPDWLLPDPVWGRRDLGLGRATPTLQFRPLFSSLDYIWQYF